MLPKTFLIVFGTREQKGSINKNVSSKKLKVTPIITLKNSLKALQSNLSGGRYLPLLLIQLNP